MKVKVVKMGGDVSIVNLKEGSTVDKALESAGMLDTSGYSIRVNGLEPCKDQALHEGNLVVLVPEVRGGLR